MDENTTRDEALAAANREHTLKDEAAGKGVSALAHAISELAIRNEEKAKQAVELVLARLEIVFQNEEKEKRASELMLSNSSHQEERLKCASELITIVEELALQTKEKDKLAAELAIINIGVAFQNAEKKKHALELVSANNEIIFQNQEKERRASELTIANKELVFQNEEKEKRAVELLIANRKLILENEEKEKRATELIIAYGELSFLNAEREKRAAELVIANRELAFQSEEKEKRAAELVIANTELAFQNEEKEKRAAELIVVNRELEAFSYVSSHDLQEPLRKIQILSKRIAERESESLSEKGKDYFRRIESAASRMRLLIDDLLAFSQLKIADRKFECTDLNKIVEEVKNELKETLEEKHLNIAAANLCELKIIPFQFRQIFYNLISNSLKFSKPHVPLHVIIKSRIEKGKDLGDENLVAESLYCHISVSDNGIGFDPLHKDRIFDVFKRLHAKEEYGGSGIGLAIVKKVVDNHHGIISTTGEPGVGATFNIYIPVS